jgi:ElaB/YqjD/DUF883 family membrane-anchored ribosome-binding protein
MDKTESDIKQNIEETRAAMTQKIEKIEGRVHDTMEGTKSTIDNVVGNMNRVKDTIEETKSVVDTSIDTLRQAVDETVERVKATAELIDQVKQNPWIMLGSAVLVGYVLGSLNRQEALGTSYPQRRDYAREQATPHFDPQHSTTSHLPS